jgi:acyl dehydratase
MRRAVALDRERLLKSVIPEVRRSHSRRDTILYALGLGVGADPLDEAELAFVLEDKLLALPTMAVILCYPGLWLADPRIGADVTRLLHGEQSLEILRPLPVEGELIGRTWVEEVIDRGADKGAFVYSAREVRDAKTGEPICRLGSTSVLRGNGGFGGPSRPVPPPHVLPDRPPDITIDRPTLPQAALIYRLSGDWNRLHSHPERAAAAGFPRPILHGLCTFGVAGLALVRGVCGGDPSRLIAMKARFTAPVYPGETLRTEIWREPEGIGFRALAVERNVVVMSNGLARLSH